MKAVFEHTPVKKVTSLSRVSSHGEKETWQEHRVQAWIWSRKRKERSLIKCMLTLTCIFTCLHTHTLSVKSHIIQENKLVSDLIPESFNKCNCKNTGTRGRYEPTTQAMLAETWIFFACAWHQKSLHSMNRHSLATRPSSFRFLAAALCRNGFASTYT